MDQEHATTSRIEALLQRVLEKVDGLERQIETQNVKLDKLESVQSELQSVRADVQAVQVRHDALGDVVRFAAEEQARRINQEWQQIKFVSVIHVVASVGVVKEVLVCFSLNRSTWIDVRLWRVVINNVYKHRESGDMYNRKRFVETRLLRQCRRGRESSVQRLLRLGSNVHITNQDGRPALTVASGLGRTRLVSALIAAGADVNFGSTCEEIKGGIPRHLTALMMAASRNFPDTITVLIRAGADMNQEDSDMGWGLGSRTALMWARKKEAAKTLLALGADINYACSKGGKTALIWSAFSLNPEMVKYFIEAGADVNIADDEGDTALIRGTEPEVPEFPGNRTDATEKKTAEVLNLLLAAGADVNHANNLGKTAIFCAAYSTYFSGSLRLLQDTGADVQHTDNEGRTALFEPALFYEKNGDLDDDHVEAVKLLIAAGADVNHVANDGSTALSRYTAALQTAIETLQNADEDMGDVIEELEERVARLTEIVALINERIALLA